MSSDNIQRSEGIVADEVPEPLTHIADPSDLGAEQVEFSAFHGESDTIEIGGGYNIGSVSKRRMLTMAAVAPTGSDDPVDRALRDTVHQIFPTQEVRSVPPEDFDGPKTRKYSLARIHDFETTEGEFHDLVIARGNLDAVMNIAHATREQRAILQRNAQMAGNRGYRCLAVAFARVDDNGETGPFEIQGFINVRPLGTGKQGESDHDSSRDEWVRLELWSPMLRLLHWSNVAIIFLLCLTGYYIMDPFFGDSFFRGIDPGFLMGIFRFIHFASAAIWIAIGLVRLVLAFIAKDRYMRWSTFWPFKKREDVKNLGRVLGHYLFLRKEAPTYLAHNPLQQLAYTGIYVLGAIQMLTGLSLYALAHNENAVWKFLQLPTVWFGIPNIRLFHALVMYLFIAFVIGHIYLAFRADTLERHGGISAMVGGSVWLKRGSKPVDAPEV